MKGRDKRKRAKARKGSDGIRCQALVALIDSSTCRAEQRIRRCLAENKCRGCDSYVSIT